MDSTNLRLIAIGLLLLGAGCTKTYCDAKTPCAVGNTCDLVAHECVLNPIATCNPGCATAYQDCVGGQCVPRYYQVSITAPAQGAKLDGGTQMFTALLLLADGGMPTTSAPNLTYTLTPKGGTASSDVMVPGTGVYQAQWNPTKSPEGAYQLVASFPDPAAGLTSAPVNFTLDKTGPVFALTVPSPVRKGTTATFNEVDPMTDGGAWRRDETVRLVVTSNDTDVDPKSVQLVVVGFDGTSAGPAVGPNPVTGSCNAGEVPDGGYCGIYNLPLGEPGLELKAFRGQFGLLVSGNDMVGNKSGVADGGVQVTRWKWDYAAGTSITASPAIGNNGRIYFGTNSGSAGQVMALDPDGTPVWTTASGNPIAASPAVGALSGSNEVVYYGTAAAALPGTLLAINGSDGGVVTTVCLTQGVTGDVEGALTVDVTTSGPSSLESAVGVVNASGGGTITRIVALRPGATALIDVCPSSSSAIAKLATGSSIVASGDGGYYYGDTAGKIEGYNFNTGTWNKISNWPVSIGASPHTLAISGSNVIVGSFDTIAGLDEVSGTGWKVTGLSQSWDPSISTSNQVLIGIEDNTVTTLSALDGGSLKTTSIPGILRGAPAIGRDGRVYVVDDSGELQVFSGGSTLTPEWALSAPNFGVVNASVALDCSRNGGVPITGVPGVLYIPSQSGHLTAIVVDSRGLDPNAPWPKYQHDPRNTGNVATPIPICP